jgi:hypothetical protein
MSQVLSRIAALAPEQRKLLEQRLREENIDFTKIQVLPRSTEQEEIPLSFAQERLWFLDQLQPGKPHYNMSFAIRVHGQLNSEAMEQAVSEIVRRHEILRTSFVATGGVPAQKIASWAAFRVDRMKLLSGSGADCSALTDRLIRGAADHRFDLSRGPLLRVVLLYVGDEDHILLLTMHHIVSDGLSMAVFVREIVSLYDAFSAGASSPLRDLTIQYADFTIWQRRWLGSAPCEKQLSYWRQQLRGLPVMPLVSDRPRPAVQTYRGATQSQVLPRRLITAINELSRREDATPFMTFLAAFNVLLGWYSKQQDILIGAQVANRGRAELEGLIGLFLNTLVMRTDLSGNPNFREVISRVREVALGAYDNQDLPFDRLLEALRHDRDLSASPLFQVVFGFYNIPTPALKLSRLTLSFEYIENRVSVFDLILSIYDSDQGVVAAMTYNRELFDQSRIERMTRHFVALLQLVSEEPESNLGKLYDELLEAERKLRLVEEQQVEQTRSQKLRTARRKAVRRLD